METARIAYIRYTSGGVPCAGSGLQVGARNVLTAGHVAGGTGYQVQLAEIWYEVNKVLKSDDPQVDLAILTLKEAAPSVASLRYAAISREHVASVRECVAVGYPWWKRKGATRVTAQVEGTIPTAEGLEVTANRGLQVSLFTLVGNRDPEQPDIPVGALTADDPEVGTSSVISQWAGMSGAVVVTGGDVVVGVIRSHNLAGGAQSLTVTPITAINGLGEANRKEFWHALGVPEPALIPKIPLAADTDDDQPTEYKYDVFISYPGGGDVEPWVRNRFVEEFRNALQEELGRKDVFLAARTAGTAEEWQALLADELKRSRVLLAILSKQYFLNVPCLAELESMIKRQAAEGGAGPARLVHGISAYDCKTPDAVPEQYRGHFALVDFTSWAYDHDMDGWQLHKEYTDAVHALAEEISRMVDAAPAWRSSFPIAIPPTPVRSAWQEAGLLMAPRGQVITFYSYKGGVGRSFLLASVAVTLARWGFRVVCLDWDLEAPGLRDYFEPYMGVQQPGLLEIIEAVKAGVDFTWPEFVTRVDAGECQVDFIAAGGGECYSTRVQSLDWTSLFEEHDFAYRLEELRQALKEDYDFILVDSRTGISNIGGVCAVQLPDVLLMVVTANHQSIRGTLDIAERIPAARDALSVDRLALPIIPVLSRFDAREELALGARWQRQTADDLGALYEPWLPHGVQPLDVLERTTVPYVSAWSFGERIPVLSERTSSPESISWAIESIGALLANGLAEVTTLLSDRDAFVRTARTKTATQQLSTDILLSGPRRGEKKLGQLDAEFRRAGFLVTDNQDTEDLSTIVDNFQLSVRSSAHLVMIVGDRLSGTQENQLRLFLAESVSRRIDSRIVVVSTEPGSVLPQGLNVEAVVEWTNPARVADEVARALALRGPGDAAQWSALLTERSRTLGLDHPSTISAQVNWATAIVTAGAPADGIHTLRVALLAADRALGPDDSLTLTARLKLAGALADLGQFEQAIIECEGTLDRQVRIAGRTSLDVLDSRHQLGVILLAAGRINEARLIFVDVLREREIRLGAGHRDTLAARRSLANAMAIGRPEAALPLLTATLDGRVALLGPDHPDTLTSVADLANARCATGQAMLARRQLEQVLEDRSRVLGPGHRDTLSTRADIAIADRTAGRYNVALAELRDLLVDRVTMQGTDHRDTLATRAEHGYVLFLAGQIESAIPQLENSLSDYLRVLGAKHPATATVRLHLADAYRAAGQIDRAIPLLEENLAEARVSDSTAHLDTLTSRNNLAMAYRAAGRLDEALPLLEENLTASQAVRGPEHPDTLTSGNNLAIAYRTVGRLAAAIELHEATLTARRRVLGSEHPDTLGSANNLAEADRAAGRLVEAIELHEATLTARRRVLGPEHPDTLTSANNLAESYREAGRFDEAIELQQQVQAVAARILGPSHVVTLANRANLGRAYRDAGRTAEAEALADE